MVSLGLGVFTLTALMQAFLYSRTLSVALGLASFRRSLRSERLAGPGQVRLCAEHTATRTGGTFGELLLAELSPCGG